VEPVPVIDKWTGLEACRLQACLRMTNEGFANHLGVAVRTIAAWHDRPEITPRLEIQQALDSVLARLKPPELERFAQLSGPESPAAGKGRAEPARDLPPAPEQALAGRHALQPDVAERLRTDPHIAAAFGRLDTMAGWPQGEARRRVATALLSLDSSVLQDQQHHWGMVRRSTIADALWAYYGEPQPPYVRYRAACDGYPVLTSVLTRSEWLDLALPLNQGLDRFSVGPTEDHDRAVLDDTGTRAAVRRLAQVLASHTRLVNAPLFRLRSLTAQDGALDGRFGLCDFASYALTLDLLENELLDAVSDARALSPAALPLRAHQLPDLSAAVHLHDRLCVGGTLALCAIARPASRARRGTSDYVLLVQERSGKVLNGNRRLSVIPKAFHQPLADYSEDVHLGATLERELEEELFGREDVDSTFGDQKCADPMHPSRLSPAMKWLIDHDDPSIWRMECTGFGVNLLTGNYEFPGLIVIDDPTWWEQFGGVIEANWESSGLRRYSSLDRSALGELIRDPAWSNEGLFALLQGLRRLDQLGEQRVDLPSIELEIL